MAHGTYDDTHQRIIDSGMKMFLANGYERTNLRDLCAAAGITTGSFYRHFTRKEDLFSFFVQPAVDDIQKMFTDAEPACREVVRKGNIRDLLNIVGAKEILDYIYLNFDALKLLLKCSDGTGYNSFLDDVIILETDISLKALRETGRLGIISCELPSEIEMHIICHAYISSVFEAALHDLSREEMDQYISKIVAFFTAGSYKLLGV